MEGREDLGGRKPEGMHLALKKRLRGLVLLHPADLVDHGGVLHHGQGVRRVKGVLQGLLILRGVLAEKQRHQHGVHLRAPRCEATARREVSR